MRSGSSINSAAWALMCCLFAAATTAETVSRDMPRVSAAFLWLKPESQHCKICFSLDILSPPFNGSGTIAVNLL